MDGKRWCHACQRVEDFDASWFEAWIGTDGELVLQPVSDPTDYHKQFRGDIFACGEGSALILVERYLQSRTFDPTPARTHSTDPQFTSETSTVPQ
jgi:hypothetical protein